MKHNLLIIDGPLNGGGAERVLLDMLHNLDYSRYEVDLMLVHDKGRLQHQVPNTVNVLPLWSDYTKGFSIAYHLYRDFGYKGVLARRVKSAIKGKIYNTSISFLEGLPLLLHSLVPAKQAGKKLTWVHCDLLRFPYTDDQFSKDDQEKCYGVMDHIVSVSEFARKAMAQRFPMLADRMVTIYNPVDIASIREKRDAVPVTNATFTIVVVGRYTPEKKLLRLITLAKRLRDEGYNFTIKAIGEGKLRPQLEQAIIDNDLLDYIKLTGFMENPYPEIAAADMLLSISGYEGFGLTICEAMCLGVPVVSTRTAGPSELLGNDEYGLLCDHDETSIYNAVKRMIDDKELRQRYVEAGLNRVDQFSTEHFIKACEQCI